MTEKETDSLNQISTIDDDLNQILHDKDMQIQQLNKEINNLVDQIQKAKSEGRFDQNHLLDNINQMQKEIDQFKKDPQASLKQLQLKQQEEIDNLNSMHQKELLKLQHDLLNARKTDKKIDKYIKKKENDLLNFGDNSQNSRSSYANKIQIDETKKQLQESQQRVKNLQNDISRLAIQHKRKSNIEKSSDSKSDSTSFSQIKEQYQPSSSEVKAPFLQNLQTQLKKFQDDNNKAESTIRSLKKQKKELLKQVSESERQKELEKQRKRREANKRTKSSLSDLKLCGTIDAQLIHLQEENEDLQNELKRYDSIAFF